MAEQLDIDFLRERDRHAEALLVLSRRIEAAASQEQAFDAALDILRAHTPYLHFWVYTFAKDASYAEFYMGSGPAQRPQVSRLPVQGDRMMEEIVAADDIVIVEDAPLDPRTDKAIVDQLKCRTIINVPIIFDNCTLGAVGTGTFGDEGVRLPSPAERDFLKAVASHLAISLDRLHNRSEWQRAEKELQAGEARYRSLVQAMAEGVIFQDAGGIITAVNPAAERILGISASQLIGETQLSAEPVRNSSGAELADNMLPWAHSRATGLPQADVTLGLTRLDGSVVWLSANTQPLTASNSAPYAVVTTFRDITEQRDLQQQLRMVQVALDGVTDSAFMMEHDRILQVNSGACKTLGYSREELAGKSIFDIDPQITPDHLQALMTSSGNKDRIVFESIHRRKDGFTFDVEVEVSPFTFDNRNLAMALTRDITERKKNEQALRRLNRTLLTLSSGNEALVRAGSEQDLLERMSHILVEVGGHRVVWIDLTDKPNGNQLYPAATAYALPTPELGENRMPCTELLADTLKSREPKLITSVASDVGCGTYREQLSAIGCCCGLVLPLVASRGLIGTLSIFAESLDAFDKAEFDLLRELADDLAFGIQAQRIHSEQQQAVARLQKTMEATIVALADTLELRDPYTAGHQRRVAHLAKAIALRLGFDAERAEAIYLAGMIHDIGKIYVPAEVLSRPGRLTPLEFSLVQTHVEAAYGILHPIDFPWPLADIVHQHHERLDGSGYPRGIHGDEIMLESRILAVADVVEAMSAHRPYRPGLGIEAAMTEIKQGRGKLFDPDVVDQCVALFTEDAFQFE